LPTTKVVVGTRKIASQLRKNVGSCTVDWTVVFFWEEELPGLFVYWGLTTTKVVDGTRKIASRSTDASQLRKDVVGSSTSPLPHPCEPFSTHIFDKDRRSLRKRFE
jgi:hypothetical protein